jgi:hypothetical protein
MLIGCKLTVGYTLKWKGTRVLVVALVAGLSWPVIPGWREVFGGASAWRKRIHGVIPGKGRG